MPRCVRTINSINFEIESTKFQIWERKKGPEAKMFDKETARNGNSCSRGNFKSCECTPCRNFLFLSSFPRANSLVFWFVKKKKRSTRPKARLSKIKRCSQSIVPCTDVWISHGVLGTQQILDDLTWLAYTVCHSDSQSADNGRLREL